MEVSDRNGRRFRIERELKRGGEGTIGTVRNHPDLVAKIYHRPGNRPEAKLAWMVDHPPDDPAAMTLNHISIAWPRTLLYDGNRFVGCLMPYIGNAVPLLQVFNPRLRRKTMPGFDWSYLHRTAANLASAVSAVHAKGYVIGDINEGNFVVQPDTLITLLDCDSFQVIAQTPKGRQVFRCPVGKVEYTAPELQGVPFATVDRTADHDSFGLGVLIFQLLLNGNHPFRSDWRGGGDAPEMSVKISRGLFPYDHVAPTVVAPPEGAPPLDWIHPALREVMIRCFVDGHRPPHRRPSAEDWERAVKTAERALARCKNRHVFSGHQAACPWCAASRKRLPVVRKSKRNAPPKTVAASPRISTAPSASPAPIQPPASPPRWPSISGLVAKGMISIFAWLLPYRRPPGQRRRLPGHVVIAIVAGLILLYAAVSSYSR
jgi:DNA-binding helix-hairpin-helix protein with protein kinase domain